MGQLTQQRQMLIRLSGNPDGDISSLIVTPGNALRELKHLNTGFQDHVAGIGGAMGDCDAVAEER